MPRKQRKSTGSCSICSGIPEYKFVETLHTSERLPEEVDQLLVIGGYGLYGCEQVRKCPECGTFYSFLHDHDSESGVGYGYTDEAIQRLSPEKALDLIEKTLKLTTHDLAYWDEKRKRKGAIIPPFLDKQRAEVKLLETERDALRKKLDVS